jgi:predicted  nucleic acid-binding Zn-ribbon protein
MAKTATKTTKKVKIIMVEDKLKALYQLQCVDSNIDNIRVVRGELPLEIQDLEDDISGLNTRIEKYNEELTALDDNLAASRLKKKDAKALIKKYDKQIANIKNNREYESLSKEIEFQTLEIELCEKKEKEIKAKKLMKDEVIAGTKDTLKERKKELKIKNGELDEITKETEKEEKSLIKKSDKAQKVIEDRLLNAYSRIRTNVRNGLAVVSVDRDACGGCKNMIPPQRQLDIRMHKKVIVCEHCGRILIDANMFDK